MDITTTLGLVAGAIVLCAMILMGGDLHMFVSEHAILVIFGGAFSATLIRFPLSTILHGLPIGARFAFTMRRWTSRELPRSPASRARSGSKKRKSRIRSSPRA